MDSEDGGPALEVGGVHGDLPVEAPGAQQRGVEHIGPVGRRDEDDVGAQVEAVEFDEQLVERLLALVVAASDAHAAAAATASISSTKTIAGAFSLALANRSRTREAPTPTNISTNSEAEIE